MKKASGSIRIDLAQYREMEIFTQFASDLDASTQNQLKYGKGLMELLNSLCAIYEHGSSGYNTCYSNREMFVDVPVEKIKSKQAEMLDYFDRSEPTDHKRAGGEKSSHRRTSCRHSKCRAQILCKSDSGIK